MKRILLVLTLMLPLSAFAQVEQATLNREGDQMKVSATIQLDRGLVKGVKAFVLQPRITDGENTVNLAPIGLYTRDKFYPYLEPYGFTGKQGEIVYSKNELPVTLNFEDSVPYQRWMDGGWLEVAHEYEGCCGDSGTEAVDTLNSYNEPPIDCTPAFRDVVEERTFKTEIRSGYAVIDFPVNSVKLNEAYHANTVELGKIKESIDVVLNDKEATIESITIQGQASPEGRYDVNARLAEGRTQAIVDYIAQRISFPVQAQSIPENWEGLREWVEDSSLANKDAILEIIDSDDDPDVKEQKLHRFGADYSKISRECLPYLRRTAYAITYKTKDYEAVDTHIEQANAAMARGDYAAAEEALRDAGNGPEVEYTRGTLASLQGDYESATIHFQNAVNGGLKEAQPLLDEVSRYRYIREVKPEPAEAE